MINHYVFAQICLTQYCLLTGLEVIYVYNEKRQEHVTNTG